MNSDYQLVSACVTDQASMVSYLVLVDELQVMDDFATIAVGVELAVVSLGARSGEKSRPSSAGTK